MKGTEILTGGHAERMVWFLRRPTGVRVRNHAERRSGPSDRRPPSLVARALVVLVGGVAAVVAFAPLAGPQVIAGDDSADEARPGTWRGTGGALGVRAWFNMEPRPLPVDDFLTLHLPDVSTSWSSTGDVRARASSIFPGQTVVGLPDLLATFGAAGIDEVLPPYPATAFAGPTDRDVTSADGTSRAWIGDDLEFIEALGQTAAPGVTDALSPFVDIEGAVARSRQEFQEGGVLVSRSESRVGAVSIVGGLVTFDGVRVLAEARATETGEPEAITETDVGNVSIAGTRVRVGDEGIEVGGMVIPPGGLPETLRPSGIAGRVNDIVKAYGLSIRLLGSDTDVDGRAGRARSGGVIVEAAFPLDGPALPVIGLDQLPVNPNELLAGALPLPVPDLDPNIIYRTYLFSAVIGEANADVFADAGGTGALSDLGDATGLGDFADPSALGAGGDDLGLGSSDDRPGAFTGNESPGSADSPRDTGMGPAVAIGGTEDQGGLVLLGANIADRVGVLFAVLALMSMAALAGLRLVTLPVRRERVTTVIDGR